jgi:hypothetical protein
MIDLLLEDDDIESLEELKIILRKEQETPNMFIGVFNVEPKSEDYPINSLYKREKTVYINTTSGWIKFLEDGEDGEHGKTYAMGGGGLGYNDVVKTVQTTQITSNNITVGTGYTNSNATYLTTLLHDFDSLLTSGGGGGSFTGTIDASAVNVSGDYINTSATKLDVVIKDFDTVISKKVLFGEYKTNDMFEEDYIYVGAASLEGKWYVKRVEESGDNIYLRYANLSNNPSVSAYSTAISNRATLNYSLIQDIII